MADGKRDWATNLGAAIRVLWVLFQNLIWLGGLGLVGLGLWMFDERLACIVVGFFISIFTWPARPVRRK